MKQYEDFIALSKYARWREEDCRRETWEESVKRYIRFFAKRHKEFDEGELATLYILEEAIVNKEVMPSMRSLMVAGPALERDNVAGFNCSYLTISRQRAFDEMFYILMCGTGVGYSVERQYINKLPTIPEEMYDTDTTIVVGDSKIGWATSFRELISLLYAGKIPQWDMSKVRAAGVPLKTFGGRASGPGPLDDLFKFTVEVFRNASGRKLNSIECHDICCKIGEAVVVGGVRRSACISLSNLTDDRMRRAKSGDWWVANPQRALANNSVAYTEKPDIAAFMEEWMALMQSGSGERGLFNRAGAVAKTASTREASEYGVNPCGEIVLRDRQFCNLSEVVVRNTDTFEDLQRKVRLATILGTLQATLTNFRYLSKKWKENTEEEALLGVSLTGIMDHFVLGTMPAKSKEWLTELKETVVETNKAWANKLGINPATASTCVKPSGTVSQLVDSASGIHPRYSDYYTRTVRSDEKDPLAKLMIDQGVPHERDVNQPRNWVFSFPMKAPEGSVLRNDRSAVEQLEHWEVYQTTWCDHNASITVYVKDEEWLEVGAWVYKNFDKVIGVTFLPHSNHTYKQAPYQEITEEVYNQQLDAFPTIDWSVLGEYEKEDRSDGIREFACVGGQCEL